MGGVMQLIFRLVVTDDKYEIGGEMTTAELCRGLNLANRMVSWQPECPKCHAIIQDGQNKYLALGLLWHDECYQAFKKPPLLLEVVHSESD